MLCTCRAGCVAEYVASVRPWCSLEEHVADTEKLLHAGRGVAWVLMRCLSTDFDVCDSARNEDDARDDEDMVGRREQGANADLHACPLLTSLEQVRRARRT